jgi:hypothetical protein
MDRRPPRRSFRLWAHWLRSDGAPDHDQVTDAVRASVVLFARDEGGDVTYRTKLDSEA